MPGVEKTMELAVTDSGKKINSSSEDLAVTEKVANLRVALLTYRPSRQSYCCGMAIFKGDAKKQFSRELIEIIDSGDGKDCTEEKFQLIGQKLVAYCVKEIVINQNKRSRNMPNDPQYKTIDSRLLRIVRAFFPDQVKDVELSVSHHHDVTNRDLIPVWEGLRNRLCLYQPSFRFSFDGVEKEKKAEQIARTITALTDSERTGKQYRLIAEDLVRVINGEVRHAMRERRLGGQGHYGRFRHTIEPYCRAEIIAVETDLGAHLSAYKH